MTTATLQQLVHLHGRKVGRRAVIVGAEHVSFSAVATLAHGGASVAGLVTELPRHQSLTAFRAGAARPLPGAGLDSDGGQRDPRHRAGRVGRADRARLRPDPDGRLRPGRLHRRLDPRPRAGGDGRLRARPRQRSGPLVDTALRTTTPGRVRGRQPAAPRRDRRRLRPRRSPRGPGGRRVPAWSRRVAVADRARSPSRSPLAWVAPNLLLATGHPPPRDRFLLRSREFVSPSPDSGPPGRSGAVERPGRPAGAGALGPHPRRLGRRRRPVRRPRDRRGEIGLRR